MGSLRALRGKWACWDAPDSMVAAVEEHGFRALCSVSPRLLADLAAAVRAGVWGAPQRIGVSRGASHGWCGRHGVARRGRPAAQGVPRCRLPQRAVALPRRALRRLRVLA